MSKQWLQETENQIQALEQEEEAIAKDYEQLGKTLEAVRQELGHWKAVLESYKKRQQVPQPSLFLQEDKKFDELSQKDIILWVRDQNDGMIPMQQVTRILRRTVKTPDNASSSAYTALKRLIKQGKVVWVRKGMYRWANGTN